MKYSDIKIGAMFMFKGVKCLKTVSGAFSLVDVFIIPPSGDVTPIENPFITTFGSLNGGDAFEFRGTQYIKGLDGFAYSGAGGGFITESAPVIKITLCFSDRCDSSDIKQGRFFKAGTDTYLKLDDVCLSLSDGALTSKIIKNVTLKELP